MVVAVSRIGEFLVLGLLSALLFRLGINGDFLTYVKPSMRPWLLISGAVLAVLCTSRAQLAAEAWSKRMFTTAKVDEPAEPAVSKDHSSGPRLGWFLVLPIAAVLIVSPQPLGSYAASRQAPRIPDAPASGAYVYPSLEPSADGTYTLKLFDFLGRARWDKDQSLGGKRLRLIGFVSPDQSDERYFLLTRMAISCCAADGAPLQVRIAPRQPTVLPTDTWVSVEGTWAQVPLGPQDPPLLTAETVTPIVPPSEPYET